MQTMNQKLATDVPHRRDLRWLAVALIASLTRVFTALAGDDRLLRQASGAAGSWPSWPR